MLDFAEIARMALAHADSIVRELFPMGQRRGREFVVGDIHGNRGDSLSVNLTTGIWKDFQNGEARGGDLTSLVAAAKGISQSEAAEWLEQRYSGTPSSPIPVEEFYPIIPSPEPPESVFSHPRYGQPSDVYAYCNQQGGILNFICRFQVADGKVFAPLTYGKLNGKEGWHWKQLPSPRPLYRLETLPESGSVTLVEGEKAAEALAKLLPDAFVLTWSGGALAIAKTDWSPLFSKRYDVLLWPDNDDPGMEAMHQVASILKGKVASIGIVDVSELPPKSDAADWAGGAHELRNFLLQKRKAIKSVAKKEPKFTSDTKIDPLSIPGLIGDTVRWIVSISDQPRADMALYNTLAFAGAVFGRRYESPKRTRTNVYIVGTGETGSGKNLSRQAVTRLAAEAGLLSYLGGNSIRSDTGMLRGLMNNGSQVLMLDEFGQFLRSLHDPKMLHYRNIMRTFLTLYSDSNSLYHHGDYADPKAKSIIINSPNLCIYGTTTEAEYIPSLKKSAIESGELNRFIVLPMDSGKKYPLRESPPQTIPDTLVEAWQAFSPKASTSVGVMANSDAVLPVPKVIPWSECDDVQYRMRCEQEDIRCGNTETKALWGRLHENTIKVAMILAIGRDGENPSVGREDFLIAESMVRSSIFYIEEIANLHMAESEYEMLVQEMLAFIKKHSDGVDKSSITRRFQRVDGRRRDDILRTLIEQDSIEAVIFSEEGMGRKKTVYRVTEE